MQARPRDGGHRLRLARLGLLALALVASASLGARTDADAQEGDTGTTTTAPTSGQQPAAESIRGRIRDEDRRPIEGVELAVRRGNRTIGEATTDGEGVWEVPVPSPGTYQVTIDTDSLSRGAELRDPDRATIDVDVGPEQNKGVIFPIGEPRTSGVQAGSRFFNLVGQGIRVGAVLAVASIGLSLIYGVTGFVNFSHGELVTWGALIAFYFSATVGGPEIPLPLATVLAMLFGGVLGFALERGLFGPLRHRRSGNVSLIVVSIGLGLLLRNVFQIVFGERPRPYSDYTVQENVEIGPFALPPKDFVIIGVSIVVLIGVGLLLQRSRIGTAMRAVADDRDLAAASGINVDRIILAVWIMGAGLAALGGVFQGISDRVIFDMGFALLLLMFAAVILGGLGTAYGAMVGGLLIGVVTEVSTYWIESKYKLAAALAVLILVVLVRPQGILGRAERVG